MGCRVAHLVLISRFFESKRIRVVKKTLSFALFFWAFVDHMVFPPFPFSPLIDVALEPVVDGLALDSIR